MCSLDTYMHMLVSSLHCPEILSLEFEELNAGLEVVVILESHAVF